jgi:hypothetical protein
MFGLARVATWVWVVLVVAALGAIILGIQYSSVGPLSARAAPNSADNRPGSPGPGGLADLARRGRELHAHLLSLREQLAATQTQADVLLERVATLDAMLAGGSLTQCPVFLQEETTVRALQGIIREAVASEGPGSGSEPNRLDTAAAIARDRLRRRLEMLRDDLRQQAVALADEASGLRRRIREQAAEIESIQARINHRLRAGPDAAAPSPA